MDEEDIVYGLGENVRGMNKRGWILSLIHIYSEPDGGQFKELMPGMDGNNERSPWNIAKAWNCPAFIDEMRFWHRLRINLLPYLYSTALQCCREYRPMMRPLVYDWQQEDVYKRQTIFNY